MKVLKDIKISKDRIPVQNALWIRPMGGLSFKLYIPSGVDWKEVGIDNKPSPSPTPSGKKSNCEGGKVIVGKCIAKYPTVGDRYYFADGIVKIKKYRSGKDWFIDLYNGHTEKYLGKESSVSPCRLAELGNYKHDPVIAEIIKGGQASIDKIRIIKTTGKTTKELLGYCETTSPFFKIINGYIRHIRPEIPTQAFVHDTNLLYRSPYKGTVEKKNLSTGWEVISLAHRTCRKMPNWKGNPSRRIKYFIVKSQKKGALSYRGTRSILFRKVKHFRAATTYMRGNVSRVFVAEGTNRYGAYVTYWKAVITNYRKWL